jgi:hypothetical protein
MEAYRSGHNELDSKCGTLHGTPSLKTLVKSRFLGGSKLNKLGVLSPSSLGFPKEF